MVTQEADFKWQDRGGFILLYAETERAETYADNILCDDDHDHDEWSGGIPYERDEGMELLASLESDFVVTKEG